MSLEQVPDTGCCPKFDPEPWDDKLIEWKDKKFLKDKVLTFFFMPINFGSVMKRLNEKVEKAGATMPDWLCLSEHTSRWNMDVYLAVDKDIPGAENLTMSGKFFSKVYEGPYGDTGKWSNNFKTLAESKGLNLKKWFMWYTTCPKCAKVYGKNYVVMMSEIT